MEAFQSFKPAAVSSVLFIQSWYSSLGVRDLWLAIGGCIALQLAYGVGLGLYRLYFHPLAGFPGPKIAALTQWYEFYFDIIKSGGGMYMWEVEKMHREYGPVVRITPHEVHVSDPDWYDVLYAGPMQQREKYPPVAKMVATPLGVFGAIDHFDHRKRRQVISPFFSKRVAQLKEPLLREKVELLCRTLQTQSKTDGVIELRAIYLGFATDVTCTCTLGASPHPELLRDPAWQKDWQATLHAMEQVIPLIKQIPWALKIALKFPSWVYKIPLPNLARLVVLHENMHVVAANELRRAPALPAQDAKGPSTNIFQTILHSDRPASEKSLTHLTHQGLELISAGGETVARVLAAATYHILANPGVLARLRAELDPLFAAQDVVTVKDLEQCVYLTAVLKESLRCGAVVSTRMPLVSPRDPLVCGAYTIPPGAAVSMTPHRILHDPACYDSPYHFRPERWMASQTSPDPEADAARIRKSERYFFAFSKGGRNCLGMNLAWSELYLVVANVVVRFEMGLYDTVRERDVDVSRDLFMGRPRKESKGLRVRLGVRKA